MKRSLGLILSAIVLSLAALFLLLTTALMVFVGIFAGKQASVPAAPHFVTYFMVACSVFYAVLAVWAILTVIGILRLRSWARYSILIIGSGLAALGILSALGTLMGRSMLPTLQTQQPAADPHIMAVVFLFMTAVDLLIAAVGIWWLVYFNLRSVRELFSNPDQLLPASAGTSRRFNQTPTAIKIIAAFLLLSSVCCLLGVFLPFPAFLLGFILPLAATHIFYLCFAAVTGWMGYGLLRLKESARLTTIAFQIFGCINVGLALLPWYQAQLRLYMTQIFSSMPTIPGQPQMFFTYTRTLITFSLLWCLLIYGIVFWLLHRHRAAFKTPAPPAPTMLAA
jgi:hypothetical protein